MSLRDEVIERLRQQQKPAAAILASQINSLSTQEKEDLILKILSNPCEGGRVLRSMMLDAFNAQLNQDADQILAGQTIDRTTLETLFSEV